MGGFVDDHVAIMGDWMAPSPSPRSYFASVMTNDASENRSWPPFPGLQGHNSSENGEQNHPTQVSVVDEEQSNSNAPFEQKMSSRGGLMERIAARAGFNAPRLNTQSIRTTDLSENQEIQSPYLTIPPGLSPTSLLDSPVFLTNSKVLPSPTTGKFSFAPNGNRNSILMTENTDKGKENTFEDSSSFAFKPIAESGSIPYFNSVNKVLASSGFAPQPFPNLGVSANSNTSLLHRTIDPQNSRTFSNSNAEKNAGSNLSSEQTYNSVSHLSDNSPPLDEAQEDDGDQRSGGDPNHGGAQAEDGYNWRKYGQKQVKGSEYPRSYYKCTHPNCPVKKKVERSQEGHITEIIYKGVHNHPKPPPNRRSSLGSSSALDSEQQNGPTSNGDLMWQNVQNNLEATSSAHLSQDYGNGTALGAQNGGAHYEAGDCVDASSTFSNDEDEEDRATHGSVSLGYDGEGDESESKRRRIENYAAEMSGATRAIREPRVVVQTTSEVDILDDGYRWRKYGQKVVKGNPNPRSYYKCTSAGCNVRKHVERASHDLKSVITTYEGKHNHDVPAARNSSHVNSGPTQQSAASSHIHRPEPSQMRSNTARFERPPLGSFGLPGRPQMGPGFGYGMNHAGLSSMGLAGLGHSHNPYLGHPPRPMNDMAFMMPKQEPKMEPVTDSGLNSSDGSSVYHHLMSRLPLGQ